MSVLDNISSIKIKGGNFEEETELPLFKSDKQKPRFSLLYGKNGTGKSTISRAFNKLVDDQESRINTANLLNKDGDVLSLDEVDKKSIYVYNEDFIEQNIRIEDDGLNAIVVMGAKKDIDDKIKNLIPQFEKVKSDYDIQKIKYNQYNDAKNKLSPAYYEKEMVSALKGDTNWAGRDAYIHARKRNSTVNTETYKQFLNLSTSKTRDELIIEYDQIKRELENAKAGSKIIPIAVNTSLIFNDVETSARALLGEKIEEPVLTEREKYLFSLLSKENGAEHLQKVKMFFTDDKHKQCPFCFQNVEKKYASELIESIEKILSKKVEEHQEKLRAMNALTYELNLNTYREIDSMAVADCEEKLKIMNQAAEQINAALSEKASNVYCPITLPEIGLKEKYENLIVSLKDLEKKRKDYNSKATDINPIINQLKEINSLIANYDIKEIYKAYQKQTVEKGREEHIFVTLQNQMHSLKKQLDDLEEEKKNVRIAMNSINDDLKYIFFSKDRLRIEYCNDKYVVYSHGKPVEPNNVSVGERNAIGLCYYFSRIMENKDELAVYNTPYLLVIDDPVSSFDMENRVGILSYLKYELNKFAIGNTESRFLIMTHDLQILFDTSKFVEEILKKCSSEFNGQDGQNKNCVNILELQNSKAVTSKLLSRNEYTALLEIIYDYAIMEKPEFSMSIGNIMRKVLEAFGTFTYRKGIDELSTDKNILEELDEPYRKYFENLMYRLVLNGGSHLQDKVKTLDDMKFFDYISDDEKQRTAKDILCFLYKLNSKHILAHLKDKDNVEKQIQKWCEENIEI